MNIKAMKLIDTAVGRIATSFIPAQAQRQPPSLLTSLLFIRPGGIGDAVLLAPAIYSVKYAYPKSRITILAERRNAGVFPLVPGVDEVLCYDQSRELLHVLCGRYDVVIDTEQSHRLSAVVARFASAPVKIGFDTNERRRMFTHLIPYSHNDYEAISFAHLLQPLGIEAGGVEMDTVPVCSGYRH